MEKSLRATKSGLAQIIQRVNRNEFGGLVVRREREIGEVLARLAVVY